MDLKLEVVIIPVTDVDRAKAFYEKAGFQIDVDSSAGEEHRVVHATPPGSEASIIFGTGVTTRAPGSLQNPILVVKDVVDTRAGLLQRGVEVSEIFHFARGSFLQPGTGSRIPGPHPIRADYQSFAAFSDPDGNEWFLQEVVIPGHGR
ncbi:VOC family protein [Arthrobacter sp. TMN-37]